MEVGYHSWSFASRSLEKALRDIKDAGFPEVEIDADKIHLDPRIFPSSKLMDLKNLFKDLSLHPNSVHAPIDGIDLSTPRPEMRKQSIDLVIHTLEYCRSIECPIMVLHPSHSDSLLIGREAMRRNSLEALKELTSKAEDLGVKIALENMIDQGGGRFGSRVADLRQIIEDADSPLLGICIDTGHTNLLSNREDVQEREITEAGEYLWTLHVHDNDGKEDGHWPPCDGTIDWNQVIRSLRKVDYRGIFMMEIQERGNPDELAKRCLERATELLKTPV